MLINPSRSEPYDTCPKCGSGFLYHDDIEVLNGIAFERTACNKCHFRWTNHYIYTDAEDLQGEQIDFALADDDPRSKEEAWKTSSLNKLA